KPYRVIKIPAIQGYSDTTEIRVLKRPGKTISSVVPVVTLSYRVVFQFRKLCFIPKFHKCSRGYNFRPHFTVVIFQVLDSGDLLQKHIYQLIQHVHVLVAVCVRKGRFRTVGDKLAVKVTLRYSGQRETF